MTAWIGSIMALSAVAVNRGKYMLFNPFDNFLLTLIVGLIFLISLNSETFSSAPGQPKKQSGKNCSHCSIVSFTIHPSSSIKPTTSI